LGDKKAKERFVKETAAAAATTIFTSVEM